MWPSLVRRLFWVQEIGGSNPLTPTILMITSSLDGPEGPPWRAVEKRLTRLAHTQESESRSGLAGRNAPVERFKARTRSNAFDRKVRIRPAQPLIGALTGSGYGLLAQLGERLPCKQEVAGSNPAGSTILCLR